MPAKCPSFLELAHLVISLLCGNKPVSYSYKLVYQSTLLVGTMGDSRLGNQLADDSHRKKHQILINHKLKRKNSMEERKLNEKESLELITRMIQNTKDRMAENSGTPFLLWGYVTVIISLLVWFLLKETGNNNWQFLWFLLPVIAFPATLWSQRKARKMLKTYIDRVVDYVWTVFGLGAFLVSCTAIFVWKIPILFVILLMMGMGTALTGLIVNTKVVTIGGVLGALLSLGCFYMPGIDQILFFALAFVFMMVIPGHYMNSVAKRHKQ